MATKNQKTVAITLSPNCSDENRYERWDSIQWVSTENASINSGRSSHGKILLIATLVALVLGLNHGASAQSGQATGASPPASPEAVRSITVITVHGKIAEVNKAKKQVVLEGPEGRRVTLRVDNPYNLKAAKVGEPVVTRFYEVVTIRKKKPDETAPSFSLKGGIATASPGRLPSAVAEAKASVVVSVTAIDQTNGTVTVKAPDGTVETVKARNPKNLKQLKVGDDLVVTLERAMAISLEKEAAG